MLCCKAVRAAPFPFLHRPITRTVPARPMRLIVLLPLLAAAAAHAASVDDQDRELARWQEDIAKARQAYQAEVRKTNDRTLKALARIAQREVRGGDVAAASATWKAALAIDVDCGDAREFFTSLGRLDDVLG